MPGTWEMSNSCSIGCGPDLSVESSGSAPLPDLEGLPCFCGSPFVTCPLHHVHLLGYPPDPSECTRCPATEVVGMSDAFLLSMNDESFAVMFASALALFLLCPGG